jgi:hypothetical protein
MRHILIATLALMALSCGREDKTAPPLEGTAAISATPVPQDTNAETLNDTIDDGDNASDYQTMYVVVADTSAVYYPLHEKMFALHTSLKQEIDTMGRYYDKKLDKIVLPLDDEDDIYAGDYYPRRYASSALSLEYLSMYSDTASPKTMALVTGIYESEKSADSAFVIVKQKAPKAFTLKAKIYMGCMH